MATMETEHTAALIGSGAGGEGVQRLGDHAHVQRIARTRHECPGIITATYEKRVRKDLRSAEYSSMQRKTRATIWPGVRPWSGCSASTLHQTSICRLPKSQLSSLGTRKARAGTSPTTTTTTTCKSRLVPRRNLPFKPNSISRSCTTLPAKSEWVAHVLCIDFLFFKGSRVHKICQRGDRHSSCPSYFKAAPDPEYGSG